METDTFVVQHTASVRRLHRRGERAATFIRWQPTKNGGLSKKTRRNQSRFTEPQKACHRSLVAFSQPLAQTNWPTTVRIRVITGSLLFADLTFDRFNKCGIIRVGSRSESIDKIPFTINQEFFEVPADVSFTGRLGVLAG
jgi:hypothetical protein